MLNQSVRTRFAPSPTGAIHIGNLRSALYEYLIAKHNNGVFVLRLEDTDRERYVASAVDVIYTTLNQFGLPHDEGPDCGGPFAPYIQSERLATYHSEAERLVAENKAYYCFCSKERLATLPENAGYDRHCRDLTPSEIDALLATKTPYVIRQKMPLGGQTSFEDKVYGKITVENSELDDQVLLKSDNYPTYNFANVVDDHAMAISHVVRGSEYLSSTPKYNLLYEALGWQVPTYIHLPLILGEDGKKLSKRHGSTSFIDLIDEGYLPEAILNAIALLGWSPGDGETQEIFNLEELVACFDYKHINKAPAVFSKAKLDWFNEYYLRNLSDDAFYAYVRPALEKLFPTQNYDLTTLAKVLQPRLTKLGELAEMTWFLAELPAYNSDLFYQKKSKITPELALGVLKYLLPHLKEQVNFSHDALLEMANEAAATLDLKLGQVMGPLRLALAGQAVSPGGATELIIILKRTETIERINHAIAILSNSELKKENS